MKKLRKKLFDFWWILWNLLFESKEKYWNFDLVCLNNHLVQFDWFVLCRQSALRSILTFIKLVGNVNQMVRRWNNTHLHEYQQRQNMRQRQPMFCFFRFVLPFQFFFSILFCSVHNKSWSWSIRVIWLLSSDYLCFENWPIGLMNFTIHKFKSNFVEHKGSDWTSSVILWSRNSSVLSFSLS